MNVVQPFLCCYCLVKYCYYCKVRYLSLVHSTPFRSVAAFYAGIYLNALVALVPLQLGQVIFGFQHLSFTYLLKKKR